MNNSEEKRTAATQARLKRKLAMQEKRSKLSQNYGTPLAQGINNTVGSTLSSLNRCKRHTTPLTNIISNIVNNMSQCDNHLNHTSVSPANVFTQPSALHSSIHHKRSVVQFQSLNVNLLNKFSEVQHIPEDHGHPSNSSIIGSCPNVSNSTSNSKMFHHLKSGTHTVSQNTYVYASSPSNVLAPRIDMVDVVDGGSESDSELDDTCGSDIVIDSTKVASGNNLLLS